MNALATLRRRGVAVRLADDGRLGVRVPGGLDEAQRAWIAEHRERLLSELHAEAAVPHVPTHDTARWLAFALTCERLGLHRDALDAEFTDADRADLLDTYADDDPRLLACARTLAADRALIAASRRCRRREQGPADAFEVAS